MIEFSYSQLSRGSLCMYVHVYGGVTTGGREGGREGGRDPLGD